MNICVYSPLSGCTYIELPCELENSVKDLINIKNNNNRCFLLCHIRHLNPLKSPPQGIKKADKEIINDLDYEGIEFFLCLGKILKSYLKKLKLVIINVVVTLLKNIK